MRNMARITRSDVSRTIRELRDEYVSSGNAADYAAINSGLCGDFSCDVISALSEAHGVTFGEIPVHEHGVTDFVRTDPETGFSIDTGGPFDRELLENWPGVKPPEGMTWDDLDALSEYAGFHAGTHVFIHFDGLFYDAEAPDGVTSFFELPFFKRVISDWMERRSAPVPL